MRITLSETVVWIMLASIAGYVGFQIIQGMTSVNTILQISLLVVGMIPTVIVFLYAIWQAYQEFSLWRLCNNPTVGETVSTLHSTEWTDDLKEKRKN